MLPEHFRTIAVCGVLITGGCDNDDENGDSVKEYPESCTPVGGDGDPIRNGCIRYWSVTGCCNAPPEGDEVSMDGGDFSQNCIDAAGRAEGCAALIDAITSCVIDTAGSSCEDARAFWGATYGSGQLERPTDPTMPCYDQVIASWDAGCNWPPY